MCLVVAFMDNTDLAQTYEEFDFRHNLECIIGILNVDNSQDTLPTCHIQ